MARWDDVRQVALDLPEVVEDSSGRTTAWRVGTKAFAWERPLRRGELALLGSRAPEGPALGLRVPDAGAAEALVAAQPKVYFSVPHYDGSAAVAVALARRA